MDLVDSQYYEVATSGSLAEKIAEKARDRIYEDFIRICSPTSFDKILDVGASDIIGDAANAIERRYPLQRNLTAVGLGDGHAFKRTFPEVDYRKVVANRPLPFPDGSFDIVTSNAVVEHVGGFENQRFFVSELIRVGGRVFITAPNRYFPIEHHTAIPFLHWSDFTFKIACCAVGKAKWSHSDHLILMSKGRLSASCSVRDARLAFTGISLGPWSSNLYLFVPGSRRSSSGRAS